MGQGAAWILNRLRPQERGHYYVLFVGVVLLTYGLAEVLGASGMLAVFIAGCTLGNQPFVHKQGVANFSAAFASVANVVTFVLLGLLVFPRQWSGIWLDGLVLFLVLTFVSRPLAVFLGTAGMGLDAKHKLFMTWAGLRGAVPIVLATYPAAAGLPGSQDVFNLVFFAVVLSCSSKDPRWDSRRGGWPANGPGAARTPLQPGTVHDGPQRHGSDRGGFAGRRRRRTAHPRSAASAGHGDHARRPRPERHQSQRRHAAGGGRPITVLTHAASADAVRRALLAPFDSPSG
jgi:hypothetical protein